MPLDFPSSPSLNDLYTFNGKTWKWDGYGWISYNIGLTAEAKSLSGLNDVIIAGEQNNDILVYNSSSNKWINTQVLDGGTY
jgi:hypothetical protein